MTLMSDGLTALHTLMNTNASVEVTYTTTSGSVSLSAVPGQMLYEQAGDGITQDLTRRNWFVLAADLVIGGNSVTPTRGDTITFSADDRTEVYAVFGDANLPHWEYTDSGHEQMEIRSVLRSTS